MFFGPDPKAGAWDHAHAWITSSVPVGDEVFCITAATPRATRSGATGSSGW